MGLFRWLRGGSMGQDLIQLQVLMDYSASVREPGINARGKAAVRWSTLGTEAQPDTVDRYRAALIALLYAEVLVISSDTRAELTACVDTAVQRWRRSYPQCDTDPQRLDFDAWNIKVAGLGLVPLWPWEIIEPKLFDDLMKLFTPAVGNPKTYTALLKSGPPSRMHPAGLWSFTEMPLGQEKVCVPSAPLIAAYAFGLEMLAAHRPEYVSLLCILLYHVNRYYQTLGRFPLGGQAVAFAQAMAAFQQYAGEQKISTRAEGSH